MTPTPQDRTTVMVVHRGLLSQRDDVAEVEQHLAGLLRAEEAEDDGLEVIASDGHDVFRPVLRDGRIDYVRLSSFSGCLGRGRPDVVYVHMPVPLIHLFVSAVLRLRGSKIVFAPMAMLERSYARASWFRRRGTLFAVAKRIAVSLLRRAWGAVADWYVCLSAEEVRETRLPPDRCLLVPWAVPSSGLGAAETADDPRVQAGSTPPIAFVSRLDINRKGIDRLCAWLLTCEDALPRPAAILFAPLAGDDIPESLTEVQRRGLLVWDHATRGAALAPALRQCRGVMLLSRWEAQARVMREAMRLGLPTLAARPCHLEEAMAALGAGEVVDGDDVDAVQQSFERLLHQGGDTGIAAALFDRDRIGRFLCGALREIGRGNEPHERNAYADVCAETQTATEKATAGAAA